MFVVFAKNKVHSSQDCPRNHMGFAMDNNNWRTTSHSYEEKFVHPFTLPFLNGKLNVKQSVHAHGGTIWDCSIMLCKCLEYNHLKKINNEPYDEDLIVDGKRCIELGSGTGILGQALTYLNASKITVTDQEPVLDLIKSNVSTIMAEQSTKIEVAEYNWGDNTSTLQPPYDLIFGSDIIYRKKYMIPLIKSLVNLSDTHSIIIIAQEKGRMDEELFFQNVVHHFSVESVEQQFINPHYNDPKEFAILKLRKK